MTPSELQNLTSESSGYPEDPKSPRIDKVRALFSAMPTGLKILDVGCATGAILAPFVQRHEIHGVDISESLVRRANELGVRAVQHDLEMSPIPFADKSFDVVFCGETIEHHVDTDWLTSELNRVLKTGGRLVLTFPNVRTVLSLLMMLFLDSPPMYAARYRSVHYRDFTLRLIKIVLKNHRFRLDRALGSSFFLPRIGEFGSDLATYFPSWANTVVCEATKMEDSHYLANQVFQERLF